MPENPLQKLFGVEERADGIYIQIDRARRDSLPAGAIERALEDALVANADIAKIRDVVTRARGNFEKVGPLFEYYDIRLDQYVSTKITPLSASIKIDPAARLSGTRISPTLIEFFLKRRKVVHGIKRETLKDICMKNLFDTEVVVAEGTPPKNGTDAYMSYAIKIEAEAKPQIGSDGKADFRNIESFVKITEGQVIAKRIPPHPGEPGKAVTGEPIPPTPGTDIPLPVGENTIATDNDSVLKAQKSGVVYSHAGLVHVLELLSVSGDVNFTTGNIKYGGDVLIKGSVRPGFTVDAEGNIEIGGEIESCKVISRNGSVTIKQGIIGRKDTFVQGHQGVTVGFAQDAEIVSEGIIHCDKHIMNCNVRCTRLEAGSFIGGSARIYETAECGAIGNESGLETNLYVVDRNIEKLKEKFAELVNLRAKTAEQIDPIQRELKTKSELIKRAGTDVTDRHKNELKKWIDAYNEISTRIKVIDDNIAKVSEAIKNPKDLNGMVQIKSTAFQNARIDFYGLSRRIMSGNTSHIIFKFKDGKIQETGA